MTYEEAFGLYEDYTRALHDGDLERQAEIEAMLGDELTAFQATKDAEVAAAKKAADAVVGAFNSAKDAGVEAHQNCS